MGLQKSLEQNEIRSQLERAETQMTLGDMIEELREFLLCQTVQKLHSPHSYRGYHRDLAFELGEGTMLASELLELCENCRDQKFRGYKGTDFQMGVSTPIWIANYGCTGRKLLEIRVDGSLETETISGMIYSLDTWRELGLF